MNALHLLWIVPAAAVIGFIWGAVLAAGKDIMPPDNANREDNMCAWCPYRPGGNDEIT